MAFQNPLEKPAKALGQKIGDLAAGAGQVRQAFSDMAAGPVGIGTRAKQQRGLSITPPRRKRK
jgi:hypothetical protein